MANVFFLTFTSTGEFVPEDVYLVNFSELLKHLSEVRLVHAAGDLPDEHLDGVVVGLAGARQHPDGGNKRILVSANMFARNTTYVRQEVYENDSYCNNE